MRYTEKKKIKAAIESDIEELKEYTEVDQFIDERFQARCICGEYDDNSLDLSYEYKMLRAIESDKTFMGKLSFVLGKYVTLKAKSKQ